MGNCSHSPVHIRHRHVLPADLLPRFVYLGIADDCLRDVYVRGKYRDVILPMTVVRRLDAADVSNRRALEAVTAGLLDRILEDMK